MTEEKGKDPEDPSVSTAISELMLPYCKKYNFDDDLCAKIEQMPPLHAFITAYGYLSNEGLDARSILSAFSEKVGLHK